MRVKSAIVGPLALLVILSLIALRFVNLLSPNRRSPEHHHRRHYERLADQYRVLDLPKTDRKNPAWNNKLGYSGRIPIRECPSISSTTSDLFFWFFPAWTKNISAPVIVWLQGGPGSSSMIGLFYEMGPFTINEEMKLVLNPFTWNHDYHMLFIDSPVGTGFSRNLGDIQNCTDESFEEVYPLPNLCPEQHNDDELLCPRYNQSFAINQGAVARDLYGFMVQFYKIFPEYLASNLYIFGESYGGKYVPSFATLIDQYSKIRDGRVLPMNLKGIAVGDGLVDPYSQLLSYAPEALSLGLISKKQSLVIEMEAFLARHEIESGNYEAALEHREKLFEYFAEFTGDMNYYNFMKGNQPNDWSRMVNFLSLPIVKKALLHEQVESHDTVIFDSSYSKLKSKVDIQLRKDIMKSTKNLIADLVEKYPVLLYQGQLDYRDGILSSNEYIETLEWSGKNEYLNSERRIWYSKNCFPTTNVAGYITSYKHLTRVELNRAGHLAPMDMPCTSLEMIRNWINQDEI